MNTTNTMPFALCAYSLPHVMGYLATQSGEKIASPLGAAGLIQATADFGMAGVELPISAVVPSFDGVQVQTEDAQTNVPELLQQHGLRLIADYGALLDHDADHVRDYLRKAAGAGAKVVRATLSHVLCGDRRNLEGGWEAHLQALAQRLREVLPLAEELGIALAVENHQDATSQDLLRLHDLTGNSPAFGVTLDTGNPLAVGEDCVAYTQRIAHLVRHVHAKDYTIHFAPEGYRLVRCAAGRGVVDFAAILSLVADNQYDVLPAIEIAAQATRTIPLLDADWWAHYPPTPATQLAAALRVLWDKGRVQTEPYSSAWERGENSEAVAAEEWAVVRESVAYFRQLSALQGGDTNGAGSQSRNSAGPESAIA